MRPIGDRAAKPAWLVSERLERDRAMAGRLFGGAPWVPTAALNQHRRFPSIASAAAGLKQYATRYGQPDGAPVAVVSGANLNFDSLHFVAECAAVA
jgi:hypothetical protein